MLTAYGLPDIKDLIYYSLPPFKVAFGFICSLIGILSVYFIKG